MATVTQDEFSPVVVTLTTQDEVDRLWAALVVFNDQSINSMFEALDQYASGDQYDAFDSKGKEVAVDSLTLKRGK